MTIHTFGIYPPVNPDEELTLEFEWFPLLASFWRPGTQFSAGNIVRPTNWTGFAYERTGGGQSGYEEPLWPRELGATVQKDGDGGWITVAAGSNGVQAASLPVVESDDPDLTIGTPTVVNGEAANSKVSVPVSGWSQSCTITCQITAGTQVFKGTLQVPVSDNV